MEGQSFLATHIIYIMRHCLVYKEQLIEGWTPIPPQRVTIYPPSKPEGISKYYKEKLICKFLDQEPTGRSAEDRQEREGNNVF